MVLEYSWESLGLQDQTSQHYRKSTLNIHWKDWCWNWSSDTLATWCEETIQWKRPWCWERLKMGGEGNNRGWDGWMASPTRWTWGWVGSGSWWWTGKPGVLQYMELERVRHDLGTEQWTTTSHFYTVQNAQLLIKSLEGKSSYLFNSIISVCW